MKPVTASARIATIGQLATAIEVEPALTAAAVKALLLQATDAMGDHVLAPSRLNALFPAVPGFIDRAHQPVVGQLHIAKGEVGLLLSRPGTKWSYLFQREGELRELMQAHRAQSVNFDKAFNHLLDQTIATLRAHQPAAA